VAPPPSAVSSLDDVLKFLARYLHCSDHQRNLLALWVLHSHCFAAADFTPYLSIYSDKIQSGKTRCLQLLSLLCPNPALTASFATNNLSSRIHYSQQRPTFLLDQCHATVGSRRRSKNPVLRAILASGFQRGLGHTDRKCERVLFSPKAFAGIGPLPEDLAERSIPIHLERLTASVKLQHFRSEAVAAEAEPLREWLALWGQQNLQKLKSAPVLEPSDLPSGITLTPRRKDLIEPLLQIARLLAGDWPKRAADALTAVFQDQVQRERKHALALLYELREAFSHYGQPERISTASLLIWLHHHPEAPWNQEGPITANRLSDILRPFDIFPRLQRKKGESSHRGYTLQDFLHTWDGLSRSEKPNEYQRLATRSRVAGLPGVPSTPAVGFGRGGVEIDVSEANVANASTQGPKVEDPGVPRTKSPQPVSPNKNAACNNATTSSEVSGPDQARVAPPPSAVSSGVAVGVSQGPVLSNLSPVTSGTSRPAVDNLSPVRVDPRIKGILDDPRNYYRQYPDDGDKARLDKQVTEDHRWPQPADDKMPPDIVFHMDDGTSMPFTAVNRQPKTINALGDFKTERWPVTLDEKERLQVAVARFHELRAAAKAALEQNARMAPSPSPASSVEKPSIHAPCNNATTTSDVSVPNQNRVAQPPPAVSSVSQGPRANGQRPVLVPNPQPIPFPSRAELEAQGYRFGPFTQPYNPLDVEMIAHYARKGYRPLEPHEVDFAEFRCNGVPFAKPSDVPKRPKPPEPPPPQKSPEQAEKEAALAWLRKQQQSLPECAARENIRLAPTKRGE